MTVVVDASVVLKWFLPEVHGEAALRLLDAGEELVAPDHLFAETTNAIRKRVRQGEFSAAQAHEIIESIDDEVEIELVSCRELADDALDIALAHGQSIYDAMYIALAIDRDIRLITADDRLHTALSKIPSIAPHIQSLRDY